MIFNTNFEEQILNLFDEFHFLKEFFSFIWIILSILTIILGVTIGVLVLVWLERKISVGIQQRGLRAAAQSISYEIPLALCVLSISLRAIRSKFTFVFQTFFIASLTECERLPFDLPKAEEELVAGYQTEYSSIKFGLFYVASYLNLLASSLFVTILYLGGWHSPVSFVSISDHSNSIFSNGTGQVVDIIVGIFITLAKAYFFLFISIMTRWTLPRVRIDQLLDLGWKFLLPIALG
ncbi:unnamed protein product, partial [Sphagnum compactum]